MEYTVRVVGHLGTMWTDWLDGLEICTQPHGETILRGVLPDQAALISVLTKIHALNLTIISVQCGRAGPLLT